MGLIAEHLQTNADSCPVPKSLSWIGQFWTGDITAEIMASSEWTEWVA